MKRKGLYMCMILTLLVTMYAGQGNIKEVKAASKTGTVTTDSLNVREGAGTNYPILKVSGKNVGLKKGQNVTIYSEANGWDYISFTYNNKKLNGYVSASYISSGTSSDNITYSSLNLPAKVQKKTYVRKTASTKGKIIKKQSKKVSLKKAKSAKILKEKGSDWYQVSFSYNKATLSGYVPRDAVKLKLNEPVEAMVKSSKVKVRKSAGSKSYMKVKGKNATLTKNKKVSIIKEKTVKGKKWFEIKVSYKNKTIKGYLLASEIRLYKTIKNENKAPDVIDNTDFETSLSTQGFPESYKVLLRQIHAKYPNWQFKANHVNLDFNTAVQNELVDGRSLISNKKDISWLSLDGADYYNWATNTFKECDKGGWVNASKNAVAYYMDPRNFLNEKGVFQFESLEYQTQYQTKAAVEAVLKNTPFYQATYSFTDTDGTVKTNTYSDTFMAAAVISQVSPVHLASRVKQEVVIGTTTCSDSVSGTVPGYEGIYNFYNIGATSSVTSPIINGLNYAVQTNETYLLPWSNQYKSIVGGAIYIGKNYINRGQNTLYLEKYNVTANSTYAHQYMTNIEAANSEAVKTYNGYTSSLNDVPFTFSIPVYLNMPDSICAAPSGVLNPNNYLSSLTVDGVQMITDILSAPNGTLTTTVPADKTSVSIEATTVSSKATVLGAGIVNLNGQTTSVPITVKAEDGSCRNYTLVINK